MGQLDSEGLPAAAIGAHKPRRAPAKKTAGPADIQICSNMFLAPFGPPRAKRITEQKQQQQQPFKKRETTARVNTWA